MSFAIAQPAYEAPPSFYRITGSNPLTINPYLPSSERLDRNLKVSDYLSTIEKRSSIVQELRQLRSLPRGWDSYRAEPPNDWAVSHALQIVDAAMERRLDVTQLIPSADGGVGVCFVNGDCYSHIEASNGGELTLVMFSKQDPGHVSEIAGKDGLTSALELIREYISR